MPDCQLGVHDGPKVAMPGDRLVNGAGVSPRRRGQSTIGGMLADTDGRKPITLGKPSLGNRKQTGDCRLEYIGRPVQLATMQVVGGLDSHTEPLATTSSP